MYWYAIWSYVQQRFFEYKKIVKIFKNFETRTNSMLKSEKINKIKFDDTYIKKISKKTIKLIKIS